MENPVPNLHGFDSVQDLSDYLLGNQKKADECLDAWDIDGMIRYTNNIIRSLGGDPGFDSVQEFIDHFDEVDEF